MIDAFSIRSHDIAGNFAHDFKYLLVIVHRILIILRSGIIHVLFFEIVFLDADNFFHQRVKQMKAERFVVVIIVFHIGLFGI
ncbi:hypothetical protein SDC9_70908 [bioreactor metagenome]|uniref:Uncharacterized protein n=1 Tax=bioreactor metagenome TaxID=1076179 RepID=A0A644Y776_9ZZZZ